MAGRVDVFCDQATNTVNFIREGRIKAYAVTLAQPVPGLDLPTTTEAGQSSFLISTWHGLYDRRTRLRKSRSGSPPRFGQRCARSACASALPNSSPSQPPRIAPPRLFTAASWRRRLRAGGRSSRRPTSTQTDAGKGTGTVARWWACAGCASPDPRPRRSPQVVIYALIPLGVISPRGGHLQRGCRVHARIQVSTVNRCLKRHRHGQRVRGVYRWIDLSSSYAFEGFGRAGRYDYTRSGNPTRDQPCDTLAKLEAGAVPGRPSGMAAIDLVLASLEPGDTVVAPP